MLGINAPAFYIHTVKEFSEDYYYCGTIKTAITPLLVAFFIIAYALPLTVICVLYMGIICHLKQKKRDSVVQAKNNERTAHVARVVFTVVLVFGLSWLPYHINSLTMLMISSPDGTWYEFLRILWNCLAYGNSCANPFIYTFASAEFRKAFREVVCCKTAAGQTAARRQTTGDAMSRQEMSNMVSAQNGDQPGNAQV